jgi:hypothetical protein
MMSRCDITDSKLNECAIGFKSHTNLMHAVASIIDKNFTHGRTAIDSACTFQNFVRVVPFQVGFHVFPAEGFCIAAWDWTYDFLRTGAVCFLILVSVFMSLYHGYDKR